MALGFNAHPKHPAVAYLVRLHADIGGRIKVNRKEAERLADAMSAWFTQRGKGQGPPLHFRIRAA